MWFRQQRLLQYFNEAYELVFYKYILQGKHYSLNYQCWFVLAWYGQKSISYSHLWLKL